MSERPKEHDWKSCILRKGYRGFESLSLHQSSLIRALGLGELRLARPAKVAFLRHLNSLEKLEPSKVAVV